MFGWLGEIAKVFHGLGLTGAVVFALLLVIVMQYVLNLRLLASNDRGRAALLSALNNSTAAQQNVAVVLARVEARLGLPAEVKE